MKNITDHATRDVNLMWKQGVSWVLVWGLGVSWVLKIQQTETRSTGSEGVRVLFSDFFYLGLIMYKSIYFWNANTLESFLISYYCTLWDMKIFQGEPTTSHLKILEGGDPRDWRLCMQWRKSGLKSGGRGSGWKNFDFSGNFTNKNWFFMANFRKISIFFQVISQKILIFKANFRQISNF